MIHLTAVGTLRFLFLPQYKVQPFQIAPLQWLEGLVQLNNYRTAF